MTRTRFFLLAFVLVLISVSNTGTHAQTRIADHFLRDRSVRRIQPSNFSLPPLGSAAADAFPAKQKPGPEAAAGGTKLDFFPDVSMVVDWTDVVPQSGDAVAWYGRVQGAPYGQATFVRTGDRLIGSATRGDGKVYQVRTAEDGSQWMLEIDQSLLPDETDPPDAASLPAMPAPVTASDAVTSAGDGSTIDVLVLYTPAARQAAGGTTSMQQLVQLGIAETNQGYMNSGVIQRVRLVNTQEINYVESSSISQDLTRLRNGDSVLAEALTLRDIYGADLVSLWVDTPEATCGIGYVLSNPSLPASTLASIGFSVAERQCATGNYTFGHEMGHNMGAHHAKDDLNSDGSVPVGAYPYSNGYKNKTGTNRFRTIMAYDAGCNCPRIDYWSNPNVNFEGLPTGIDPSSPSSAANYLTLNMTMQLVANYRASLAGPPPGGTDTTGPLLTITSHMSGQTVFSPSITISGTATDAARGDNGISSVTVNGVRAGGDTASGIGIATWSRTLGLNSGANTITVVATDAGPSPNATTVTLLITVTIPTSATAATFHVFPQFADGRASDGSYYRTTLMVANPSSTTTANCTFRLYGLTPNLQSSYTFTFGGSGWTVLPFSSAQPLKSGYATLQCSATVEAQLLYSFYSAAGAKMSEATVFSSPPAGTVQVLGDNRGGSQIAIAIANDSDVSRTYNITAYNSAGSLVGSADQIIAARTNLARYVRDLVNLPADYFGQVIVTANGGGAASVIGIRFTGIAFTTIPSINRGALAPTASTYHVFPQFADGRTSDGNYYRTTIMIVNSSSTSGTCTLRLYGLTVNGGNTFNYDTFPAGTWTITTSINSMQDLKSGYATLQCGMPVEAQLLYSFYSASGTKISEATVFSSPPGGSVQVLADNREASSLAIAIANDSDQSTTYTITAYNSSGIPIGSVTQPIPARRSLAAYLTNLISLPPNHYGPVLVTGGGGSASVIGIRFTGGVFTTIPEALR